MAEPVLTENEKLVLMDLNNVESDEEYTDWVEYAKEKNVDVNKLKNLALKKFAMDKKYDIVIILIEKGADINLVIDDSKGTSLLDWFIHILKKETLEMDEKGLKTVCKTDKNDSEIENLLNIIILILDKNGKVDKTSIILLESIINISRGCIKNYNTTPNISTLFLSLDNKVNPKTTEGGKRKTRKSRKQRKSRNQKKQLRSRRFRRHAR